MTTTNDAPAPAPSGSGVRVKDWTKVAKAAGQHGVRYRTNRALEAFLTDIAASLASDASPRGEAVAWRLIDSDGDHWWGPSCSKEQFDKAARENPDLIGQPLYAHPAPATVEMRPDDLQLLMQLKRDNTHDGARPVVSRQPAVDQAFRLSDAGLIALEHVAQGVRLHITRKGVKTIDAALAPATEGRKG